MTMKAEALFPLNQAGSKFQKSEAPQVTSVCHQNEKPLT